MRRTVRISPVMVNACFMLGSEPVKVFAAEPADDDRIIVSVKARKLVTVRVKRFITMRTMRVVCCLSNKKTWWVKLFSGPLLPALGFVGAENLGHPAMGQLD
jgi:hypothetical protein